MAAIAVGLMIGPSVARAARIAVLEPTGPQPKVVSPAGRSRPLYDESHALLISAGEYTGVAAGGWPKLSSTSAELDEVSEVLQAHGFEVTRVYDPTGDELMRASRQFLAQHGQKRNVRLLYFFSGHGYTNPGNDFGYLVPVDAQDPRSNQVDFYSKALPIQQVEVWAREVLSKHALFIFDSCFSGSIFATKSAGSRPDVSASNVSERWQFLQGKAQDPVRQFIAAGGASEALPVRSSFVPMVLRALRYGLPGQADGYVTGKGMGRWIEESLPSLTGGRQNPQSGVIRDPGLAFGDMVFELSAGEALVVPTLTPMAATETSGEALRRLNSAYLRRQKEAEAAFGEVAAYGIASGQLGVKFLFGPRNSTEFIDDGIISGVYPMWIRQIAKQMAASSECFQVVGHTSKGRVEAENQRVSEQRALRIKRALIAQEPSIANRLDSSGRGSRENIVGSGTENEIDALDRRTEFKRVSCSAMRR